MEAGGGGGGEGRWQSSSSEKEDLISEAGRGEQSSSEDLISELPDSLLHHILSFLDMRCVIQTSFLSTRWRYLWASIPFLTFKDLSMQCSKSLSFVDRVLSHRDASNNNNIHTFTVEFDASNNMHTCTFDIASNLDRLLFLGDESDDETHMTNPTEDYFHRWIHVAVQHNVQEFVVDTGTKYVGLTLLPHCSLFTCKTLTTLKLMGNNIRLPLDLLPAVASSSSAAPPHDLPSLKTLHLKSIELQGGGGEEVTTTGNFFSRCPVLETLIISYCYLCKTNKLRIFAPQLNNLEINHLSLKPTTTTTQYCHITVSAPKLTFFRCKDISFNYYTFVVELSSLSCAHIDTYWFRHCDTSKDCNISCNKHMSYPHLVSELRKASYPESLIRCLQGIYNVRSLTLCVSLLELIEVSECIRSRIIPFRNLKSLTLLKTSMSKDEIKEITYLLEKCPLVETLTLTMSMPRLVKLFNKKNQDSSRDKAYHGKAELPLSSKLYHLTFVEMRGFIGCQNELEFLRFLLENAPRLEKMYLYVTEMKFEEKQSLNERNKLKRDQKKRLESTFRPALETFPSASSPVKISFF